MNILHTADWHIGKQLYKHALYEDLQLFFSQLMAIIKDEKIDVLLISGDVFDLANPSNLDKEIYFSFLRQLISHKVQVVITAGNHDSARMLDGPRDLLQSLDIHIVGEAIDYQNQLIPITIPGKDKPQLVIAAVPYLRDKDIRKTKSGEHYEDRIEATRKGIIAHYQALYDIAKLEFPNLPIIAMGHLYMQGASLSDSERDIQIGNKAGISVNSFDMGYDYFALGHIHRPQKLHESIRYSGSPISLSFSERKDEKEVVIVTIEKASIKTIRPIKLKKYRKLIRLSGTLDEVKDQLTRFENNAPLPALLEIHVEEEQRDEEKILELINLPSDNPGIYTIINTKINFRNQDSNHFIVDRQEMINELKPIDVFREKLDSHIPDEDTRSKLELAFSSLVESWNLENR